MFTGHPACLRNTLIADRIVLLYSPSGAGKSSLLEAGLRAELEGRNFFVAPTIRIGFEQTERDIDGSNRYSASAIASLEGSHVVGLSASGTSLAEVVARIVEACSSENSDTNEGERDLCLFFDQFEELFTLDPADQDAKAAFFHDLGQVLRNRDVWAVISMREDFIAQLDPYLDEVPRRFAACYRLDFLTPEAASVAASAPAESFGVRFEPEALTLLVDDLRAVHVERNGTIETQRGPVVEPVQLQVVCRQLWEKLPLGTTVVARRDVEMLAGADQALAEFYSTQVEAVGAQTGVRQRVLREWFESALITADGFRSQAFEFPAANGASVLRAIENAYLIRAERRRGITWYELTHDRMVKPVLDNNRAWREARFAPAQARAREWYAQDRPDGLLISGTALADAQQWAEAHDELLDNVDTDFLAASRERETIERREARRLRSQRRLSVLIASTMAVLLALSGSLWLRSRSQATTAGADELANQARLETVSNPLTGARTALRAWDRAHTATAKTAIRAAASALRAERGFVGHSRALLGATFSNDGKLAVTFSEDATARIWHVASGRTLHVLIGHTQPLVAAAFGPNSKWVVTASIDRTVRIWSVATGKELRRLPTDEALISAVRVSGGGSVLVACSDGVARLWEHPLDKSAKPKTFMSTVGSALFAEFVANDRIVVANDGMNSLAGRLDLWKIRDGTRINSIETGTPSGLAVNPAGTRIVVSNVSGDINIWNPENPGVPSNFAYDFMNNQMLRNLQFSADGKRLAATGLKNGFLWTLRSDEKPSPPLTLRRSTDYLTGLAFAGNDELIVLSSQDGTAAVFDAFSGGWIQDLRAHGGAVTAVAAHEGHVLTASFDGRAMLWPVPSLRFFRGHVSWVLAVDVSNDGRTAVSAGSDGSVRVWDIDSGTEKYRLTTRSDERYGSNEFGLGILATVAFSPDEHYVAAAGNWGLWIWDLAVKHEEAVFERLDLTSAIRDLSFDPRGDILAVGHGDGGVDILRWRSAKAIDATVPYLSTRNVNDVVDWSPDGTRLAVSGSDGLITLWNTTTWSVVRVLVGHAALVTSVEFSPDGETLASASQDHTVRLWAVGSGRSIVLGGSEGYLSSASFNSDGSMVAAGSATGEVAVWASSSGELLSRWRAHADSVNEVRWVSGGQLLSASDDATLHLGRCEACGPVSNLVARLRRQIEALPEALVDRMAKTPQAGLVVGDCVEMPAVVESALPVDCATPHRAEVTDFYRLYLPWGAARPADLEFKAKALCDAALKRYLGGTFDPQYLFDGLTPTPSAWTGGGRTIQCLLVKGRPFTGTARKLPTASRT